jgi:hypothetical protein
MSPAATWHDVGELIIDSWPAGPGNRGWEREQVTGITDRMIERGMKPEWAIIGINACTSDFAPGAPTVQRLFRESLPPMTAVQIEEAAERQAERRRLEGSVPEPRALPRRGRPPGIG